MASTDTQILISPPYTGPSADARITRAASYFADRERMLEIARAAITVPNELGRVEIEQLGETVELLDTLVVAAGIEHSADVRTIAAITKLLVAAQQATLASARMADEQLALRVAAQADVADLRRKHAAISDDSRALRIQAGLNTACLEITGRTAAQISAEHAEWDRRDRAAALRLEAERQAIAAIGQLAESRHEEPVTIVDCVIERAAVRVIHRLPVHERFADVLERRASRLARGSAVAECTLDDETVVVLAGLDVLA